MLETFDGTSLEDLAVRAQAKDRNAARALFERIRPWVERTLARDQFDLADVEDITQESLWKIARSLPSYDPSLPFKPWAKTIIGNVRVSYIRARRPRAAAEDRWETQEIPRLRQSPDLEREVSFIVSLRSFCMRLTPVRRAILWAYLVDGYRITDLERAFPDVHRSIRRWVKADAAALYEHLRQADEQEHADD